MIGAIHVQFFCKTRQIQNFLVSVQSTPLVNGVIWQPRMAYKPNQGTSLQERFRQMSEQERLIEQKKKEIELKQMQQKLKDQESALNKMASAKPKAKPEGTMKFTGNRL